jgi:hypothetical protein
MPPRFRDRQLHSQWRHETVPQSVPVSLLISAKCWSEWQDLNCGPLVPNEVA